MTIDMFELLDQLQDIQAFNQQYKRLTQGNTPQYYVGQIPLRFNKIKKLRAKYTRKKKEYKKTIDNQPRVEGLEIVSKSLCSLDMNTVKHNM